MKMPPEYAHWRTALGFDEVSYGIGGIRMASLEGLHEFQLGYSQSPDSRSLTGAEGEWKEEWIAIGHESSMGDPIVLDVETMRVMTAAHGEGEWTPELIAASLEGFGAALKELRRLANGRENPVQLEANPLPATYYWTSEFLESAPDGGFFVPVPSAADLGLAFSTAHLGIAITLAGTSLLMESWYRLPRPLLFVLGPSIGECVIRLDTWVPMIRSIQEGQGAELTLGVAVVSFLLPCAIGGGALFLASDFRRRTSEQPNGGRIVA